MRRLALQVGILVGLTLVAGAATKLFHPKAPGWRLSAVGPEGAAAAAEKLLHQVTSAELKESGAEAEIMWIDARLRAKFDEGHIEGAHWVGSNPKNTVGPDLHSELLSGALKKWTVVYCEPKCDKAQHAAETLRMLLGREVHHLSGDWREFR
ncbi:MAG: rhodanese-related sulfurtransferase [Verrucomicrobiales bacterium]|jgi:rhodanese-related sulfurtransferase